MEKSNASKGNRKQLFFIIFIVTIFIFAGIAVISLNWKALPQLLDDIHWYIFPLLLLSTGISYFCASQSFMRSSDIFQLPMEKGDILAVGFISAVVSNVAALGGLGTHSIRILLMSKRNTSIEQILAVSLFTSYMYNIIFFCLFPLGLLLFLFHRSSHAINIATIVCVFFLFIILAGFLTSIFFFSWGRRFVLTLVNVLVRRLIHRNIEQFTTNLDRAFSEGIESYKNNIHTLIEVVCLIFIDWSTNILTIGLCFLALGIMINPGVLVIGFVVSAGLAEVVPIPGGFGIQDGSMVGMYTLLGMPVTISVLAIVLFRIVYYFIPYLVSIVFYRKNILQSYRNLLD